MSTSLTFNNVELQVIDHHGQPWLRVPQIEAALGFTKRGALQTLYTRHADEFTDTMTALLTLPTDGGEQKVRVFSLRGCHLLAMFARTKVAKDFRRWVLDVLDSLDNHSSQPTPTLTLSTAAERKPLHRLVSTWAVASGQPHAACWVQLKAAFQLATVNDLPVDWIPDAIAWVQERIDTHKARRLPAPTNKVDLREVEEFYDRCNVAIREFRARLDEFEHEYPKLTADVVKNAVDRMYYHSTVPVITDSVVSCLHSQHREAMRMFDAAIDLIYHSRQTICTLHSIGSVAY